MEKSNGKYFLPGEIKNFNENELHLRANVDTAGVLLKLHLNTFSSRNKQLIQCIKSIVLALYSNQFKPKNQFQFL